MSKQVFPEWAMDEMALPLAIAVLVGLPCELLRMYFYAIGRPRMSFKVDVMRNGLQLALTLLAVLALPRSMALQAIVYAMAEASALTALLFAAQLGPVRFVPGMMLRVCPRV